MKPVTPAGDPPSRVPPDGYCGCRGCKTLVVERDRYRKERDQCRSLLSLALPYVEQSERSYAERLAYAMRYCEDPRMTALAVAERRSTLM